MSRQEFLEELRGRLEEEGAVSLIQENLNYYSSYIDGEIAGGKSEETVLEELGSPSLIAHSILDAAGYEVDGIPDVNPGGDARVNSRGYGTEGSGGACRTGYGQYGEHNSAGQPGREEDRAAEGGAWPAWVLPAGILLLILVLLLLMMIGVFWLLSPLLVPLLIVLLIFRLLRGGRRF